jgi:Domain of unknown function (DUF4349)
MPSPPESVIDERFEELAAAVRASKPRASDDLRKRVRSLAVAVPEPRRARRYVFRRATLVLASAALVAIVAGGGIVGLSSRDGQERSAAEKEQSATLEALAPADAQERQADASGAALPPSRARAQDYRAELRVRVRNLDQLSRATARAMRATRSLGGFVVRADYGAPGGREGDSLLVVRVPVRRVQEALLRFSQLGTIVGQRITIEDLQRTLDRQSEAIAALRGTIATLERELRRPGLTDEARARLRARLLNAERALAERTTGRTATRQRAATARIALTLTTSDDGEPPRPDRPGYFERTVRDAASALAKALAWVVAALIVAGPVLLLAALAVPLGRRRRRRADERLLERR